MYVDQCSVKCLRTLNSTTMVMLYTHFVTMAGHGHLLIISGIRKISYAGIMDDAFL